jgi:hypothetical protein
MAMTVTFKRVHTANRGASTYRAEGYPGVILLAKPTFNGAHPESIEVGDVPVATVRVSTAGSRVKMTPEERKAKAAEERARQAGLTPAQRAEEKAAKLRAKLVAAEAKIAAAA